MTTLHAQTDRSPTPNDGVYYPESARIYLRR